MEIIGRLHPLILHLPIGILVVAYLLFWSSCKKEALRPAVDFTLFWGMLSAISAAISGYILSLEGGYEENLLFNHQWLGIFTAVFSVVIYVLNKKGKVSLFTFTLLMIVLMLTGHYGGSLTHGSDFLLASFAEKEVETQIENVETAFVYADFIQPIFKNKCVSCHNEEKLKGGLLMTTKEGLQKGGETDAMFIAGNAAASLVHQRMNLLAEDKKHMPPKGKIQLTAEEEKLIDWWINSGAEFDKKVGELERPEDIENIFEKYAQRKQSVFDLEVSKADEATIFEIEKSGVKITQLVDKQYFIALDLHGLKTLDAALMKQVSKLSEQTVELDLGNTNFDESLFSYLENFQHLEKLFLQNTVITGENLTELKDLKYLTYLNLYGTDLTDKNLQKIAQVKNLKKLFLWQTKTTKTGIATLQKALPNLSIDNGVNRAIFGTPNLTTPIISTAQSLFADTLRIAFEPSFQGVQIFYTVDGTTPDTTSNIYTQPFLISKTTDIQFFSKKEGWKDSSAGQQVFAKARYQPTKISLNKKPNPRFVNKGAATLIDLEKGTEKFAEGNWLGFQNGDFIATMDMGKAVDLSRVTISSLEDTNSWIFYPKGMMVSISKDGKKYEEVVNATYPTTAAPEPAALKHFSEKFPVIKAQFIKITVKSTLINPDWHSSPGEPCWLFVDEILVE